MIGQHLSSLLLQKGHEVLHLSRSKNTSFQNVEIIVWNIREQMLEYEKLEGIDCIIHLAGANIFEKSWSEKNKQIIVDSRVESAKLLYKSIEKLKEKPKLIISASAVGYYGSKTSEHVFVEEDPAGKDFLAKTCIQWEKSIEAFSMLGIRYICLRQPMVLAKEHSALQQLELPTKLGLAAALGSGKQWMPWIHIDDLCRIYLHCIENTNMYGNFNVVAPEHVDNKSFTKKLTKALKRPAWLPKVPAILIKSIFGEKSIMILEGSRISSNKLLKNNFVFSYSTLESAFKEIYQ